MAAIAISRPAEISFLVADPNRPAAYLAASSFEPRCLGATRLLRRGMSEVNAKYIGLISYDSEGDRVVKARAGKLTNALRLELSRLSRAEVDLLPLEPRDCAAGRLLFDEWLDQLETNTHLIVDVTTLTKPHVVVLLQGAMESERVGLLTLLYSRAIYGRRGDPISWGAREPMILPGFGRAKDPEDAARLVIFCGLEPNRTYSIIKEYSGARAGVLTFVDPGHNFPDDILAKAKGWHTFATRRGWKEENVSAFSPQEVARFLEDMTPAPADHEHLLIAPLTTKWEAIATWMYFAAKPSRYASIVYAPPGRYNVDSYSRRGWLGVLRADIDLTEARNDASLRASAVSDPTSLRRS